MRTLQAMATRKASGGVMLRVDEEVHGKLAEYAKALSASLKRGGGGINAGRMVEGLSKGDLVKWALEDAVMYRRSVVGEDGKR